MSFMAGSSKLSRLKEAAEKKKKAATKEEAPPVEKKSAPSKPAAEEILPAGLGAPTSRVAPVQKRPTIAPPRGPRAITWKRGPDSSGDTSDAGYRSRTTTFTGAHHER